MLPEISTIDPNYSLTLKEVWNRLKWPYEIKLAYAKMIVQEAVNNHERLAVACSFGKSSLICLYLTRLLKPDVFVSYQDTLCDEIGIYQLKKRLIDEWHLNIIESRPAAGINFWTLVDRYGLPGLKAGYKKKKASGKAYPKCCYYLKEKPAKLLYKQYNIEAIILGLQASESNNRMHVIARYGCIHYTTTQKLWKYQPLAFWTNEDIWKFINENNLPYAKEYNHPEVDRLGCKFCTAYIGWEKKMSILHPKIYQIIRRKMGKPTIKDFFSR